MHFINFTYGISYINDYEVKTFCLYKLVDPIDFLFWFQRIPPMVSITRSSSKHVSIAFVTSIMSQFKNLHIVLKKRMRSVFHNKTTFGSRMRNPLAQFSNYLTLIKQNRSHNSMSLFNMYLEKY